MGTKKPENGGDAENGGDKGNTPEKRSKMTREEAASYVRRRVAKRNARGQVIKGEDGQPIIESLPVKADEVMAFKDYGGHVVVVTTGGEKLRGEKRK